MADNIDVTPGTGVTIGGDSISAVLYQRVKLIQGVDGVNDGDVSSSAPLQVTLANTGANATAVKTSLKDIGAGEYETVAASQTAQALGASGATGDFIAGVLVIPATLSPGNVLLLDNATSITIFTGGADSVLTLHPFYIPLGIYSVSGAWKLTTGSNVSCIGMGNFT